MIVHARAQVFSGCLARFSFNLVTRRKSFSSTYGPFFALRLISSPKQIRAVLQTAVKPSSHAHSLWTLLMRAELSAAQNQLFTLGARAAGDAAFCGDAGFAYRMASAIGSAFPAAQRMVDRIHRFGARVRADAHV